MILSRLCCEGFVTGLLKIMFFLTKSGLRFSFEEIVCCFLDRREKTKHRRLTTNN